MTRTAETRPCEEGATADLADLVDAMHATCPHCDSTLVPEQIRAQPGWFVCPCCARVFRA